METLKILQNSWDQLLEGLWITVLVTVLGCLGTLVISFILGLMAGSKNIATRGVARTIIEFFRGTSLVVQLFWFVFAMPIMFKVKFDSVIAVGIVVLALNYGAYGSEIVRGAINAVPKAQWEACVALNFTFWQKLSLVIIPQAWVGMVPPFSNLAIQVLKGSALVSLIGLVDLTLAAQQLRTKASAEGAIVIFAALLVIYFIMSFLIAAGMRYLERRAKASIGQAPPEKQSIFARTPVKAKEAGGVV
ncbi:ectoine/hydroxyectoine ABC transporter permease subunit EhuC [Stackebrandtia nassauensis]|uniref:Ectoine/hydroxyectoine ABC transporter, permease protein EhuC n=1 Tax=Stackebrandtia nassauensis (strain DSM 44728 / CIP 108903 / NRRL B-16338 / NBRC 102104 / LLR-40K-21) TaxID=446470 RepID=D3Q6K0_STANL|nr:ectoine/hydroxyectoine ABC transporter permease subunit EhuC [Stackebrandtia nassauensis]ADD44243.1 ectoine/hydroxyectoine ABC transporter, permease protein EhuC [Stackebrandtia nassauensis DSM 44728]